MTHLGSRLREIDWRERTLGGARYVSDLELPGMLYGCVLRSPHPHAELVSIDVAPALDLPGVRVAVTAREFAGRPYPTFHERFADRFPLAIDKVRFIGDEVAALAADTPDLARQALNRIKVSYRGLRAATSLREAISRNAPSLHVRQFGNNQAYRTLRRFGLAAQDKQADITVRERYRYGRTTHACMETSGTVANWDAAKEQLEIWTTTQAPHLIRRELSRVLNLPEAQIVVRAVAIGGGFGGRTRICEHEAIAAMLTIRSGRPVKLTLSRDEEFATTRCRHAFEIDLESGLTDTGDFAFRKAQIRSDNGAYNLNGPVVLEAGIGTLAALYRVPFAEIEGILVDTNKHPAGGFRGFGGPQVVFALESQIDELAARIGADPFDLRIRNANRQGDVTINGYRFSSCQLAKCLQVARTEIGWESKRARGGAGRGIGVAAALHVAGARTELAANRTEARIVLATDGTVEVFFGGADAGTGQRTILAAIVADAIGLMPEDIIVTMMDTESTPFDFGAWSQRGTSLGASAVKRTATLLVEELCRRFREITGVEAQLPPQQGGYLLGGNYRLSIRELVSENPIDISGEFTCDAMEMVDPGSGMGNIAGAYSFAAHAAEVEVDRDTGKVTVIQVVAVHDSGKIMNLTAAEGQVCGAVVQGLGAALGEELIYEKGRCVNPAFIHYALPRCADAPPVRAVFIGSSDPTNPCGAKGVGEIPIVPIAAAVANAVFHAVGVRIRTLPITPDKVLAAVAEKEGRQPYRSSIWRRPGRWWIGLVRSAYGLGLDEVLHRWGGNGALPRAIDTEDDPDMADARTPDEAVALLARLPAARVIGGGTDLLVSRMQGLVTAQSYIDAARIPTLRAIRSDPALHEIRIGAAVTLGELHQFASEQGLGALARLIGLIANPQVRNMATVAGNLCQIKRCWFYRNGFNCYKRGGAARPCYAINGDHRFYHAVIDGHRCQAVTPSDLATAFLALDAVALVAGPEGERRLPMADFYRGPGEPALGDREIVTEIRLPTKRDGWRMAYEKLSQWDGDFAIVSAFVALRCDEDGRVAESRVVLGGVAPKPFRALRSEIALSGYRSDEAALMAAARAWTAEAHPLARNGWKLEAAAGVLAKAVRECLARRKEV